MGKTNRPAVIKKYANRRLYNTGTSSYVTLDDLAALIRRGDEFQVFDARTGADISHQVLTQIVFERESRGEPLLPVAFLRRLIALYGDEAEALVPDYLDATIAAFDRERQRLAPGHAAGRATA